MYEPRASPPPPITTLWRTGGQCSCRNTGVTYPTGTYAYRTIQVNVAVLTGANSWNLWKMWNRVTPKITALPSWQSGKHTKTIKSLFTPKKTTYSKRPATKIVADWQLNVERSPPGTDCLWLFLDTVCARRLWGSACFRLLQRVRTAYFIQRNVIKLENDTLAWPPTSIYKPRKLFTAAATVDWHFRYGCSKSVCKIPVNLRHTLKTCSRVTSASSALGVLNDYGLCAI